MQVRRMGSNVAWRRPRRDEEGFTLVELIVAMALCGFLLSALASVMYSSVGALGVQKARTRANYLASVGIEDLQRLSYNGLGLCAAPSGSPPPDMGDTVILPNCASATKFGPCEAASPPAAAVPDEEYTCVERNITYTVRRFIAYGDVAHTEKRMAVQTEWVDKGGRHEVSQQSSLRVPSQNSLVGLVRPEVDPGATSVAPTSTGLTAAGTNDTALVFTAKTSGLDPSKGDTVVAVLETLSDAGRQQQSVPLASTSATTWAGELPVGTARLGIGTQYVVFTATRQSDGKVDSHVETPAFTVSGVGTAPTAVMTQQPPSTVDIDAEGDLVTDPVSVAVTTQDVAPAGEVTMVFETQTGAVSVAMSPETVTGTCSGISGETCVVRWRVNLTPANGFHFLPSPPARSFYIVARQTLTGTGTGIDIGATVAVQTTAVTYA